ncbi:OmpA family protein, partial [Photobacterium sanctipauli]
LLISTSAIAEPYIGAKAGQTWFDDACVSGQACDDEPYSFGVFFGYEFLDFFSIEGGYDYLGKVTGVGIDDDSVEAITIGPKFNIPLNNYFSLYGKLGGAFVKFGDDDDYSTLAAGGIELEASKNLTFRLEYQSITGIDTDVNRVKANTATLGVVYKFGNDDEPYQAAIIAPPQIVEEKPEPVKAPVIVNKTFETQMVGSGLFELNSTELNRESVSKLGKLIDFLKVNPQATVEVVGHTDTSGTTTYNQVISEQRAQAVTDVLEAQGIAPSRIVTRGEGEETPVATNETREGRMLNRRVEVTIPEFKYQVEESI